jgi:hypothetical protein
MRLTEEEIAFFKEFGALADLSRVGLDPGCRTLFGWFLTRPSGWCAGAIFAQGT